MLKNAGAHTENTVKCSLFGFVGLRVGVAVVRCASRRRRQTGAHPCRSTNPPTKKQAHRSLVPRIRLAKSRHGYNDKHVIRVVEWSTLASGKLRQCSAVRVRYRRQHLNQVSWVAFSVAASTGHCSFRLKNEKTVYCFMMHEQSQMLVVHSSLS